MHRRRASGHWLLWFPWQLQRLFWKAVDSSWKLWFLFLNELCSVYKYFLYFCSYYISKVSLCFFYGTIFNPAWKLRLCPKESHCELLIYWVCCRVAGLVLLWAEVSMSRERAFSIHFPGPVQMIDLAWAETLFLERGRSGVLLYCPTCLCL